MKQITIGREGDQPFVIPDEYVSRRHALFTLDEQTGTMTLTDQSSSGTFIMTGGQFQQITQCQVNASTEVRLGPFFTFTIKQLFQAKPIQGPNKKVDGGVITGGGGANPKQPQKADIAHLRLIAENYENTKIDIEQKQTNINGLRTMSLVGSIAGGGISTAFSGILGDDYKWIALILGPAIAIGFLVGLMMYCSKASKELIVKKNENEKNFKISYCCPNCHRPFAGTPYPNVLAEGKCPKCKIEFCDNFFPS